MPFFGVPIRNGLPIGLGSVAGFGVQQFDPSLLFEGGTVPGAWYDPSDLSTMFTTSAGTTPVAMPGQGSAVSVGAMLDKRATAYSVLFNGSARITATGVVGSGTGDFTYEAWVYPISLPGTYQVVFDHRTGGAHTNGMFMYVSSSGNLVIYNVTASTNAVTLNQWNHIAFVRSGGVLTYYINGVSGGSQAFTKNNTDTTFCVGNPNDGLTLGFNGYISNARFTAAAVYTGAFTPTGPLTAITGTRVLTCGATWASNPSFTVTVARVDGLNPFQASPVGNHAIAINDTTARPELRARVNLLEYSEQFDNAYWAKNLSPVITSNAGIAPDNTLTADQISASATSSGIFKQLPTLAGVTYTFSCFLKYVSGNAEVYLGCDLNPATATITLNTNTGQITAIGASVITSSITSVGNGWYKVTGSFSSTGTTISFITYTANSAATTFLLWGADLRPANIGANVPAYQRIADANTYDTNGFPLYLFFDGIDDGMYTPANLNLSATDKVGVFAGVRKLSDAAQAVVAELSATIASNNGTFLLAAPDGATQTYGWDSKGTTQVDAVATGFAAPITNVVTGTADIAGDSCIIRVNGTVADTETGDQGSGNYGTYPLNIGVRSAASSPTLYFNGHLYSLAVVGSAVSAGNIAAMENWVAGKTGIQI